VVELQYPSLPTDNDPNSWETLYGSVADQITAVVSELDPTQITFIAKSLGTIVLAALPTGVPLPGDVRAVWLTPIFGRESVRVGAIEKGWRSLLVAGEADDLHEPEYHEEVANRLGAASVVLARADHLLEVPGDVTATLAGFRVLTQSVLDFGR